MTYLFKLVILPALFALVKADFPLDNEDVIFRNIPSADVYRLPEDLDPIHYDVEITPYFVEAPEDKEPFTFDGFVRIKVKAINDDLSSLTIQENVREINTVTIRNETGTLLPVNASNPFERIREYHFLKINLQNALVRGEIYLIEIDYVGNINETPLSRGVFRGSYKDNEGKIHWYAATHLQPTHSRQAFPSFDEPGFKSTFNIIINRPASFNQTYSNMRIAREIPIGDRVQEIFHTTPRMSAYLVTFHISEDFTVIAKNEDESRPYRILARPNAQGQGEYALEVGPPITKWLEDYFDIDYYTMGEDMKNDQIASPYWASGATENWGLVTYRELRLLYEEGQTNALDKMYIATITAHELAHKWFGNLVTARWWDNVWINEGFASYFEHFATDGVYREMELDKQFIIMYLQSALSADATINTRALQHTVNSPAQVTSHFSGISYSKGASLLNMLKHFLTEATFKKALNYYLIDREYEHAFPEDVYRGFQRAVDEDSPDIHGVNITDFIKYWVDEPGYPVLTVTVSDDKLELRQERFFINPDTDQTEQVWPLPLTYVRGSAPDWNNLTPSHVMTEKTLEITKPDEHEWVIFNVQQKGIYRVNYDTHNWEMIAAALERNLSAIDTLNRAQIVDDIFALMRSERISYDLGFKVLEFLKKDTSYYSWYPAISGFNWFRNRLSHVHNILPDFDRVIYEYLDAVITELGYDVRDEEPLTITLNRFFILAFACNIGHEGCIDDAVQKFNASKTGTSVNPNLRRHVFCTGLQKGDYDDWKFLYQRRLDSNNQADELATLRSMGCTGDEKSINEHLEMILTDEVKAQDRGNAFTWLLAGNVNNAKVGLEFLKNHVDEIRKSVVLATGFNSVLSNWATYLDEEGLDEYEGWLQENQASLPEFSVGISAISTARDNMRWASERASQILRAARGSAVVVLPKTIFLFITLITLFLNK